MLKGWVLVLVLVLLVVVVVVVVQSLRVWVQSTF
jgi:hypothetical protein